jgi:hemolysin activation/secretion protein
MKQAYVGGDLTARPTPWVVAGAGVSYEDFMMESGTGSTPSIETVFTPGSAPGLGDSPEYLHLTASAGLDTRLSPGYARRGALYGVTYHNYADRAGTYSFDRLDAEIVQHIPLLRETWVISLHGLLQTTLDDKDSVPYFLLPSLGGGSSLRGYSGWRFRDRTGLVMSGEFRWIPNRLGLDMAIFYDTGKVTPRFHDLSFKGLASDVGIGIRFHGPLATPLRIDIAKGREGIHLVFGGSAAF